MNPTSAPELVQRQIRERLAQEEDRLAREARDLLQQALPGSDSSQMANLLASALEARGPEVLKAWIRYQAARSKEWWKKPFVDHLLAKLEALEEDGRRLAAQIPGASETQVTMELIRRFVGYLKWWHKVLAKNARNRTQASRGNRQPTREG